MTEALQLNDVYFAYLEQQMVLKGISFRVNQGERVGIIGPNGSGKSTLLLVLNGILTPAQGHIQVFSLPVCAENKIKIRQQIGVVFQNPEDQLFCPTVFEDVAFGPLNFGLAPQMVEERVHQALQEVGLTGFEERSTLNLSFGEKKLVAIATVLAMHPKIVALDEPTSNLDALHRRKIINWIQTNGRTCLITSHDLDMIYDTCERTILLNKGQIVADGKTEQILKDEALLQANDLELPLKFQTH